MTKYTKTPKIDLDRLDSYRRANERISVEKPNHSSRVKLPHVKTSHPVKLLEDEDSGDRFLLYATEDGVRAEFQYKNDTLWMTQGQIAEFFGKDRSSITRHIINIFKEGELDEANNVQKVHIVNSKKPVAIYSLDMVISVGYRVTQSKQATLLRKWSTTTLVQFATSGFVVDKKRLAHPDSYNRVIELREIIRDIRASEANVYREIRQICTMCQDYESGSKQARNFYSAMQNKLLWAIASKTAAEIIAARANAHAPNMGLQIWPNENIRKADVSISPQLSL